MMLIDVARKRAFYDQVSPGNTAHHVSLLESLIGHSTVWALGLTLPSSQYSLQRSDFPDTSSKNCDLNVSSNRGRDQRTVKCLSANERISA